MSHPVKFLFIPRVPNYHGMYSWHHGTVTYRWQVMMLIKTAKHEFIYHRCWFLLTIGMSGLRVTRLCVWFVFSRRLRRVSGLHLWNAAAAHISSPSWCYYGHRLPWGDPNEDAEDAYFASCGFQSGHRWVRYSSCLQMFCSICWQLSWNEVTLGNLLLRGSNRSGRVFSDNCV